MINRTQKLTVLAVLTAIVLSSAGYAGGVRTDKEQELLFSAADGQQVAASSLKGRVVVLMFSGVQDPQCRDELKALETLSERYQAQPVSIYWVSINSTAEAGNDKLAKPCGVATSVRTLRLSDLNAFKRIRGRSNSLPTLVVLNKQNQPYGQPRSGFNPNSDFVNDVAELVDSLLSQ